MNQRMYMQIRSDGGYWEGSNGASHPTHPVYWSEIRHVTQEVGMDIAGVNSSGGPQASGRVAHEDMIVLKDVDKMTPQFYTHTCRGQGIDVIVEIFDLTDDRTGKMPWDLVPDFVYILRGVSITSQKITNARTVFERREYNLTNTMGNENDVLTGFTDVGYTSPKTIARETLTFLYSDLRMEIFGKVGDTRMSQKSGFWDATKNTPLGDYGLDVNTAFNGVQGRFYRWSGDGY